MSLSEKLRYSVLAYGRQAVSEVDFERPEPSFWSSSYGTVYREGWTNRITPSLIEKIHL
ncbi:hypothetical protein Xenpb_00946 [Xenorhabdus sp. PB62.4]|nr:hypothetical protein [Xenorhabdus sp. PB62.4]